MDKRKGMTALLLACEEGCSSVVGRLLEFGADSNARSGNGETALMLAAGMGHAAVVEVLVSSGHAVNLEAHRKRTLDTAVLLVCRSEHASMVGRLLELGADTDARSRNGETVLMLAAARGHAAAVDMLVLSGRAGDLEAQDATGGTTALQLACRSGHSSTVGRLLELGANAAARSRSGDTLLMLAASGGHADVVQELVSAGRAGDLEARDKRQGKTARQMWCRWDFPSIVGLLLELGATPDRVIPGSVRPSCRPLIEAALAAGPRRQLSNLRWHSGRRQAVLWRWAASRCVPE